MNLSGLFITGTDTNVGKTVVATAIVRQLRAEGVRVGAYKPAASGAVERPGRGRVWEDIEQLSQALGNAYPAERICPQRFAAPLAPPLAAAAEGRTVDSPLLRDGAMWWQGQVDFLVVEGAGGLLSPLSDADSVADLARDLALPLIVVARAGLGTINHTLLTLEAAQSRGLTIAGIVLNQAAAGDGDPSVESNPAELQKRTRVPVLAVCSFRESRDLRGEDAFRRINWRAIAHAHSARPS
jgi:dethiobiotin synthetase